jgi:hypothetical protein
MVEYRIEDDIERMLEITVHDLKAHGGPIYDVGFFRSEIWSCAVPSESWNLKVLLFCSDTLVFSSIHVN